MGAAEWVDQDEPLWLSYQQKELSNGRLGMLAAAGFMAQEAVSGKTWSQQDVNFEGLLLGGYFSQEAAEVARDAAGPAK